jgi:hypothetical protein
MHFEVFGRGTMRRMSRLSIRRFRINLGLPTVTIIPFMRTAGQSPPAASRDGRQCAIPDEGCRPVSIYLPKEDVVRVLKDRAAR